METLRRARQIYAEEGLAGTFDRALYKLVSGHLFRNHVAGRKRLKSYCSDDALWTYAPRTSFTITPPDREGVPRIFQEYSRTYDCFESFVCEVPNVTLIGEYAMCLLESREIAVEPHRPISGQSGTFEGRLRQTAFEVGTHRLLWELTKARTIEPASTSTYDLAAHFVMRVPTNFGHWILEYLPKIRGLKHYIEATGERPILLINQNPPEWMTASLRLYGFSSDDWIEWTEVRGLVDRLVIPSTRYIHSYDYEPYPPDKRWLHDEIGEKPTSADDATPSRIYISRQKQDSRRVINFDEVQSVLDTYDIVPVAFETLDLREQIDLCRKADVIVGPHGSGFANCVWAEDAVVVEFHPNNHICVDIYVLSHECGFNYDYLLCDGRSSTRKDEPAYNNLIVNTAELERRLEAAVSGNSG